MWSLLLAVLTSGLLPLWLLARCRTGPGRPRLQFEESASGHHRNLRCISALFKEDVSSYQKNRSEMCCYKEKRYPPYRILKRMMESPDQGMLLEPQSHVPV